MRTYHCGHKFFIRGFCSPIKAANPSPSGIFLTNKLCSLIMDPILLVGMRNVGKTFLLNTLSDESYEKIDMDQQFQRAYGGIDIFVAQHGWDIFRQVEYQFLESLLDEKVAKKASRRIVIATGGGIIETEMARRLLINFKTVWIQGKDEGFLVTNTSKPSLGTNINDVWLRRKPFYREVSTYDFYVEEYEYFGVFLDSLFRLDEGIDYPEYCLILTQEMLSDLDLFRKNLFGINLVEYRYDLLYSSSPETTDFSRLFRFIKKTFPWLRILFTIRTSTEGGKFTFSPESAYHSINEMALRSGYVDFIDIEYRRMLVLESTSPIDIFRICKRHKVVLSYHQNDGENFRGLEVLEFLNYTGSCKNRSSVIPKIIGESFDFEEWKSFYERELHGLNIIAHYLSPSTSNTRNYSRCLNYFYTPIIYLSGADGMPGIYSFQQYFQRLSFYVTNRLPSLHFTNMTVSKQPKKYYLVGNSPTLDKSLSPFIHNKIFSMFGLDAEYSILNTSNLNVLLMAATSQDFGGFSVTIPYKAQIAQILNLHHKARDGPINTVYLDELGNICLENTDKLAIYDMLHAANFNSAFPPYLDLVIYGAGATAHVFLEQIQKKFKIGNIFIKNRSLENAQNLIQDVSKVVYHQTTYVEDGLGTEASTRCGTVLVLYTLPLNATDDLQWYPREPPSYKTSWIFDVHYIDLITADNYLKKRPFMADLNIPKPSHIWNGLELLVRQALFQSHLFLPSYLRKFAFEGIFHFFMHELTGTLN